VTRGWWLVVIPCRVALFGGAVARPTGFLSAHKARTVGPLSTFLLFTCTTRTQRRHQPHTGNSVTLSVHRLQHILHPGLHSIKKRGQRRLQHRKETHIISGVELLHGSIYSPFIYVVTTHTHTRGRLKSTASPFTFLASILLSSHANHHATSHTHLHRARTERGSGFNVRMPPRPC